MQETQLRLLAVERSRLREVVRFQQVWRDLEVLDRIVAVTLDHSGEVLTVTSDAVAVSPVKRGPMSATQAADRAVRAVVKVRAGAPLPKLASGAREVVFAGMGGARHAWAVRVVRSRGSEHLRVLVDANDGQILQVRNLVRH